MWNVSPTLGARPAACPPIARLTVAIGLGLTEWAGLVVGPALSTFPWSFWAMAALVVFGQLRPLRVARRNSTSGTVTSTAFLLAILYAWGLWPSVLLAAVVCLASEAWHRNDPWILLFRVCEPVVSVASAWLVLAAVGLPAGVSGAHQELHGADLLWIIPSWVVWFLVDHALGACDPAHTSRSFADAFRGDIVFSAMVTAAVLALSPLVVVSSHESPWYLVVLLLPLVAVHEVARLSVDEQHKALHDWLTGLPNRKFLLQIMGRDLGAEHVRPFVLALLDLDRFKEVNDTSDTT